MHRHILPPYREKGQQPGKEGQERERGLSRERRMELCRDQWEGEELNLKSKMLQIFRLPGKGGYSTRHLGTTSLLIIWAELRFMLHCGGGIYDTTKQKGGQ